MGFSCANSAVICRKKVMVKNAIFMRPNVKHCHPERAFELRLVIY